MSEQSEVVGDKDQGIVSPSSSRPSSAIELGPVKTGRLNSPEHVLTSNTANEVADDSVLEMKKKEPLPPIGSSGTLADEGYTDPQLAQTTASNGVVNGGTAVGLNSGNSRPRIVSYRRETAPEEDVLSVKSNNSSAHRKISTSFKEPSSSKTVECQTEWSWLEDMRSLQKSQHKSRGSAKSLLTSRSVRSTIADVDSEFDAELGVAKGVSSATHSAGGRSQKSGSAMSVLESELTGHASEQSIPFPSKEDEYGIPILHLDSDSDSSDEDSLYQYQYQPGEMEDTEEPEATTLPSIGPPEILKYQRESTKPDMELGEVPETPPQDEEDPSGMQAKLAELQSGAFAGKCEFCSQPIKPFPSLDDQKLRPPAELYCCDEYREFVQFMLTHPLNQEHHKDTKIDVKPHPPYGSKQARKDAKERAAQRMRERELARQQAAIQAGMGGGAQMSSGAQANFYQFARQMKTINYQLSSLKCLEEGWTLRPPSPLLNVMDDQDVFEPEPMLPPWAESQASAGRGRKLILKYYEDGSKFIIFFPDGTGNVFYPSGRVAVTITSVDQGLYTYIVQEDSEDATVLGVFEPSGHAVSYYNTGGIRIYLDQLSGIELDPKGSKKRKWTWKDQVEHVHAPPIQPLTYAVTPQVGVRIMGQDNVTLTFAAKKRSCRFQVGTKLKCYVIWQGFRVPARESSKLVAPEFLPSRDMDEDELFRKDCQTTIESLMLKVNNLLRFPNSPKLDKLPTPTHLVSRQQKLEKFKGIRSARVVSRKGQGHEEQDLSASQPVVIVN